MVKATGYLRPSCLRPLITRQLFDLRSLLNTNRKSYLAGRTRQPSSICCDHQKCPKLPLALDISETAQPTATRTRCYSKANSDVSCLIICGPLEESPGEVKNQSDWFFSRTISPPNPSAAETGVYMNWTSDDVHSLNTRGHSFKLVMPYCSRDTRL